MTNKVLQAIVTDIVKAHHAAGARKQESFLPEEEQVKAKHHQWAYYNVLSIIQQHAGSDIVSKEILNFVLQQD